MAEVVRGKGIFGLTRRDMVRLYLQIGRISGLGSDMNELYEIRRRLERRCENGRIA
jgi:hypothetical protein